jgi:phosphoenolpyruvate synthase/pyruvate phosphate dikinase
MVRSTHVVIKRLGDPLDGRVGGKAEGLARLVELDLPVPAAVVVPVGSEVDDPAAIVAELGEPLAVRSSALGEDARDRSAAGQYETLLNVSADGLADAIQRVRKATSRARAYGGGNEIAVIVQRQVAATKSGVAFSRDPVTGDAGYVVECAFGPGDAVVSGQVVPDRFRVREGVITARVAGPLRTLRNDELLEIVGLASRAEEGFAHPVDVEFCYERRHLWLVQCRAITTA